jgi:hypothetical protein
MGDRLDQDKERLTRLLQGTAGFRSCSMLSGVPAATEQVRWTT